MDPRSLTKAKCLDTYLSICQCWHFSERWDSIISGCQHQHNFIQSRAKNAWQFWRKRPQQSKNWGQSNRQVGCLEPSQSELCQVQIVIGSRAFSSIRYFCFTLQYLLSGLTWLQSKTKTCPRWRNFVTYVLTMDIRTYIGRNCCKLSSEWNPRWDHFFCPFSNFYFHTISMCDVRQDFIRFLNHPQLWWLIWRLISSAPPPSSKKTIIKLVLVRGVLNCSSQTEI